ncbi:hypothetical protein [Streptacidiphilus melanogenes]|uniref:hypothetical protein n=1 Tax=Streptacidiphilus melanogenes TaxID=411235 RepID=UPI0005A8EA83|nr:hypothetical protein [Streptacidiphilus melanogenes]
MSRIEPRGADDGPTDSPNGRSGCCYEETLPRLHRLCPGSYEHRATPTASSERRRCSCRCHVEGVEVLNMPTMQKLLGEIGRGVIVQSGRWMHGNWKGPKTARALRADAWPLR